jgi:hypothetical protein
LIQYDLPVASGTSGSPVFNHDGEVIGINAAGFEGQGDFNFAIRIDELAELMVLADDGTVPGTSLDETDLAGFGPCNTSFYSSEWRFGFNLPDWAPERQRDLNFSDGGIWMRWSSLFVDEEWMEIGAATSSNPGGLSIDEFVETYVAGDTEYVDVLRQEWFTTSNGARAFLYVIGDGSEVSGFKAITLRRDGLGIGVSCTFDTGAFSGKYAEMEEVVRSICTD